MGVENFAFSLIKVLAMYKYLCYQIIAILYSIIFYILRIYLQVDIFALIWFSF